MSRRIFRAGCLVLPMFALMAMCWRTAAAPAIDEAEIVKKAFGNFKERLPKAIEEWSNDNNWKGRITYQVKAVRQIGPTEAKVTIVFTTADPKGEQPPQVTQILVVFLQYHDRHWTTARFEHSEEPMFVRPTSDLALRLLILAIDECTEN